MNLSYNGFLDAVEG